MFLGCLSPVQGTIFLYLIQLLLPIPRAVFPGTGNEVWPPFGIPTKDKVFGWVALPMIMY